MELLNTLIDESDADVRTCQLHINRKTLNEGLKAGLEEHGEIPMVQTTQHVWVYVTLKYYYYQGSPCQEDVKRTHIVDPQTFITPKPRYVEMLIGKIGCILLLMWEMCLIYRQCFWCIAALKSPLSGTQGTGTVWVTVLMDVDVDRDFLDVLEYKMFHNSARAGTPVL